MTQDTNIKPWYKMTEIGVIPADWIDARIWDSFKFKNGLNKEKEYFWYWTPIVNYMDVYNFSWVTQKDIKWKVYLTKGELKNFKVDKWDVLFTRTSETVDEIWVSTVILEELKDTVFSWFVLRGTPFNDLFDNEYKKYCFTSSYVRTQIISKSTYTTRALTNWRVLADIKVPIPQDINEQKAIAQVLSDTDELITSLDQLISKKEKIKQWAMQELLTGKRRLPWFSWEWEEKRLWDIWKFTGSWVDKLSLINEVPVRLVNYMDVYRRDFIYWKELNHWVTAKVEKYNKCKVKKWDIFFTPSSETRQDIWLSAIAMEDIDNWVFSYHITRLRMNDVWDLKFTSYVFKTKFFMDQAEEICEWSGKRYVVWLWKFRLLKIFYPIDVKEQSAISEVIYNIDREIANLKEKRDKYKQIKDWMMQELLTGRIRLV